MQAVVEFTTSAANANGFLLASLSKTLRLSRCIFSCILPKAFPIKASEKPAIEPHNIGTWASDIRAFCNTT
jgi:hypothetical protein